MMQNYHKNTEKTERATAIARLEKLHPHKTILYLAIFGSSLVFLFMILSYTASQHDADVFINFKFPKAFIVSLVLLLFSSYAISKVLPAFLKDDLKLARHSLGITLLLGVAFTISQYIGWSELYHSGIYLSGKASGAYLYVISGLHVLHLAAGLVFLTVVYTRLSSVSRDPVKTLILVTNPYQRIRLEMLTVYWHFVDALWLLLFFYFLFSF
uniref:Cytochrome c oxidase subunit 3 n=1 Tax=Roseihalotalea indica TaxID=2867963 RepID=A0AA49GT13_9BACT|nr:cytochrome c oxidase subunit 3 [Tunicatimonas sp. TK19036]